MITSLLLSFQTDAASTLFSRESPTPAARVVIVTDPEATIAFQPQPEKVRSLVNRGLLQLTGKTNVALAWRTFVSSNDVVGLKIHSEPGANSGTRSSVVAAVIEGLIASGIDTNRIIIWDKELTHLRLAGYGELAERLQVRIASSALAGFDEKYFYESPLIGNLVWGDAEFGKKGSAVGRKSFVTKLVSNEITKIISIVPLLNHNLAGTMGNLGSLALGSVDNTQRFEQGNRLATALPKIYELPAIRDKVVLNLTDALLCQYQGEQRSLLHYSTALNQIWLSKDPIALDVLAIQELNQQRLQAKVPASKLDWEIYENASLLELGVSNLKNILIEKTP